MKGQKKLCSLKMFISVSVGFLETVRKDHVNSLGKTDIRGRIESIQITAHLKSITGDTSKLAVTQIPGKNN